VDPHQTPGPDPGLGAWALGGLAFLSGAFSFALEVLWTRSLVLVIGSSVYAFNLVLFAALTGIAGGTLLHQLLRARIARPRRWLGVVFGLTAVSALVAAFVIGRLPDAFLALLRVLPLSFWSHQLASFAVCLAALLPVTLLLGLGFPLLGHLARAGGTEPGSSGQSVSGRLYAFNTSGAIAGALAADLWLVPAFGLQRGYLWLAALPLAAAAALLGDRVPMRPLRWALPALALGALAAASPLWRPWDPLRVTAGVYRYGVAWRSRPGFRLSDLAQERRLVFYEEGREAVVAVGERLGTDRRFLSVNGKTDAGSGAEDVLTQKFIAHVPLLLHPRPKRALVIGWGAGATAASAALHPLEHLECVEIEPATWRAAPFFDQLSGAVRRDPRFRMVFRDGRNHLLRSTRAWDVIVSEPSNPWISGVSNLFTREFYEIARSRLSADGVFGQWFHYYNLEPADLAVELATFASVFPHTSLWLVPPVGGEGSEVASLGADVLLVGSRGPQSLEWSRLRAAYAGGALTDDLRATAVLPDEAALAATWAFADGDFARFAQDASLFPGGTPLNTDEHPWIEFAAPRRNVLATTEVVRQVQAIHAALADAGETARPPLRGVPVSEEAGLLQAVADRLNAAARPNRARRVLQAALEAAPPTALGQERLGQMLAEAGQSDAAERRLREAVRLDPGLDTAWDRLAVLYLDRKDYARSAEAHGEVLRLRPRDVQVRLRFGAVLARLGRWGEARAALQEARRLDPKAPVDPALLAYLEARIGS
jgi:spermidine synthase